MLSSSVCTDPKLVPPPSARTPEPGWALDEVMLAFPLLLSSSVLLLPPVDNFDFRCPKLLLYLTGGPGFGDPDIEDGLARSEAFREPLEGTEP